MDQSALMDLWNAIDSPKAETMPLNWRRHAYLVTSSAGIIESYMRPSLNPGIAKEDGGLTGAGPKQLNFWDVFDAHVYDATIPEKQRKLIFAYVAANAAGKTIGTFVKFCQHLRDHALNGQVFWLIASTIDSIKGVPLRTIWQLLPRSMFGSWSYHPQQNLPTAITLILPNDRGTIELWPKTENQDIQEYESETCSGWLWTECRREAILHALEPRMRQGGFGLMDYFPCEGWHAMFREEANLPGSKVHYTEATVLENQHNLAPGFVHNEMPTALGGRGTMTVNEWKLRGLGKPAAFQGVVFKEFDPEVHVVQPFKPPSQWPLYMAGDWGYRNDHAFLLATVAPNEQVFGIAEEYDNETTVFDCCTRLWSMVNTFRPLSCGRWGTEDELFLALRAEFNLPRTDQYGKKTEVDRPVADFVRRQWAVIFPGGVPVDALDTDQSDGGRLIEEFWRCGFPAVVPVKANKHGGVELVRRNLEQLRFFLFDGCRYHRRDMMTWRYKENKDRVPDPEDRYERKNDHGCASIMYLLRSSPVHHRKSA